MLSSVIIPIGHLSFEKLESEFYLLRFRIMKLAKHFALVPFRSWA